MSTAGMPAAALEIVMVLYLLQWKVIESEVPIPDELLEYGPNLSGHSSWLDTYFWSGKLYGKACCWEWTPKRNVVQWDWTSCSNYEHHFRVNGGHNRVSLICDHLIKGKYLLIAKFGVGSTKGCTSGMHTISGPSFVGWMGGMLVWDNSLSLAHCAYQNLNYDESGKRFSIRVMDWWRQNLTTKQHEVCGCYSFRFSCSPTSTNSIHTTICVLH